MRGPGPSFSDVVRALVAGQRPRLRDVAGIGRGDDRRWQAFARERQAARRASRRRAHLDER